MIKGKTVKEKVVDVQVNYRKLDALNQSMIKLFDTDPVKFYEEFKLGKKRKDNKSISLVIGDMVDFYLLACRGDEDTFHNRFDEKFALYSGSKGTGQVFILADKLFELTQRDTDEDTGKVKTKFETRFMEACSIVQTEGKYKGKTLAKVLEDFDENGREYFEMLCANIGKIVVDTSLVDKALYVGNKMKNDDFTRDIFSDIDGVEYLTHVPIVWKYWINHEENVVCKSEVDIIKVDHKRKMIFPMDLKTTYDNESFDYMYIKNGYYLQNAFYFRAVESWAEEKGWGDYKIMPMAFVVGDTSANNRRPLVYQTDVHDMTNGLAGFNLRGNHYRGIDELISEINWCESKNIWDCSRDSYEKDGQMKLNIKYD